MTKSDLIDAIADGANITKVEAKKALTATLDTIAKALKEGDSLILVGFGTFSVAQKSARTAINPRTKEKIEVPARKAVKFKAGSALNDLVK